MSRPLPWKKVAIELYQGGTGYAVVAADGSDVFDNQTYYNSAPSEEDADFIVKSLAELQSLKASHAELVQAGGAVFGPIIDSTHYGEPFTEEHKRLLEAWDEALATARKLSEGQDNG